MRRNRATGPWETSSDCRGRTSADVLLEAASLLRRARAVGETPILVLHYVDRLADSVTGLLKTLDRTFPPGTVAVRDPSGLAASSRQILRESSSC